MSDPSQRKKVMIVDDSAIVLAVAQHALETAGFEVITHPKPTGCIALVLQEAPDLLLIDVNMPGLNGDTVVKMLGSTQSNAQMVVLLFSSLPADVLAAKATASRAHGFIRKTESPQDLVRQVSRWIRPTSISGAFTFGSSAKLDRESSDGRMRASGNSSPAREESDSRTQTTTDRSVPVRAVGKILLVDQEMLNLSEYRRLVQSQPGPVEFALSGTEVLRRLQGESPPDVVVMGRLVGPPNGDDVLREAARLSPRWKARFIVMQDGSADGRAHPFDITRLRRPVTEATLCGAIQDCLQYVS